MTRHSPWITPPVFDWSQNIDEFLDGFMPGLSTTFNPGGYSPIQTTYSTGTLRWNGSDPSIDSIGTTWTETWPTSPEADTGPVPYPSTGVLANPMLGLAGANYDGGPGREPYDHVDFHREQELPLYWDGKSFIQDMLSAFVDAKIGYLFPPTDPYERPDGVPPSASIIWETYRPYSLVPGFSPVGRLVGHIALRYKWATRGVSIVTDSGPGPDWTSDDGSGLLAAGVSAQLRLDLTPKEAHVPALPGGYDEWSSLSAGYWGYLYIPFSDTTGPDYAYDNTNDGSGMVIRANSFAKDIPGRGTAVETYSLDWVGDHLSDEHTLNILASDAASVPPGYYFYPAAVPTDHTEKAKLLDIPYAVLSMVPNVDSISPPEESAWAAAFSLLLTGVTLHYQPPRYRWEWEIPNTLAGEPLDNGARLDYSL